MKLTERTSQLTCSQMVLINHSPFCKQDEAEQRALCYETTIFIWAGNCRLVVYTERNPSIDGAYAIRLSTTRNVLHVRQTLAVLTWLLLSFPSRFENRGIISRFSLGRYEFWFDPYQEKHQSLRNKVGRDSGFNRLSKREGNREGRGGQLNNLLLSRLLGNLVLLPRFSAIKSDNSRQTLSRREWPPPPLPPVLALLVRFVSAPSSSSVTSPSSSSDRSSPSFFPYIQSQVRFAKLKSLYTASMKLSNTEMMTLPTNSSGLVWVRGLLVALDRRRAAPKDSRRIFAASLCWGTEQWFSKWMKRGYLHHEAYNDVIGNSVEKPCQYTLRLQRRIGRWPQRRRQRRSWWSTCSRDRRPAYQSRPKRQLVSVNKRGITNVNVHR